MHLNGNNRRGLFSRFFTSTLVLCIVLIAWSDLAWAAAPGDAKPGQCKACHSGKPVLPENHVNTGTMKWQQCLMCHKNDKILLKDRIPVNHVSMLSESPVADPVQGPGGLEKPSNAPAAVSPAGADKKTDGDARLPGKSDALKTTVPAPKCTACHAKPEYNQHFSATKHGALGCTACHTGVNEIPKHMQGKQPSVTAPCLNCHRRIQEKGLHKDLQKFSCNQCHGGIHPRESRSPSPAKTEPAKAAAPSVSLGTPDCTTCHSAPKYGKHFSQTAHGTLDCATCHQGIKDLRKHMKKEGKKPEPVSCAVCHKDTAKTYEKSFHAIAAKLSCLACHDDIHPAKTVKGKGDKVAVIASCLKCHKDRDRFVNKGHAAKILAGNRDAAACNDCHKTHAMPFFPRDREEKAKKREFYTGICISCHREGGVAGNYGTFQGITRAYGETYHGKAKNLGYLDKAAGCTDCHLGHNILPPGNPSSGLNPEALVKTCGNCHHNFHPRFVSYVPHPDPDNPKGFFSLYLTKKFMIALLTGVFMFFWTHSLLWWRKSYAERSRLIRMGVAEKTDLSETKRSQYVRRFGVKERIMHVILILSFFGVVLSGFPVKYTDAPWAQSFIRLMGGIERADLIHRISAAAMIALFLYTCWLSVKFLFPGFRFKGWLGRLLGPDSLFPRPKDIEDCIGMFKWFLNRGEKPQFDRWTYWEKFDFLAVFWGMFIIGGSGLIMWLPELFSHVMPGWMINIVHLAHSEEAFLAAVFIFTIHFFNNHLVPDKFPLERNIFTGTYTLEALKKERPLEFQRILQENRIEEIKCNGPGTGIQFFAGVFGIASVLIGLGMTVLILREVFRTF